MGCPSLLIPITLSTMAIVLLAPILPSLLQEFSRVARHEYWVPMILTVPALCVALFSPVAGVLGDWFGRRRLLIAALVAYGVVGVAPVFLTDLRAIIISRVGVGVAETLIMVLAFTWEPAESDPQEDADHAPHHGGWAGFPCACMAGVLAITIYGSMLFYTVQIQAGQGLAGLGLAGLGLRDPGEIGFLTSLASIGVPLGMLAYSRLGRMRVAWLLLVEFCLMTLGFLLMSRAGTRAPFLVGCFINQFGAGMLLPTLLFWAMDGLPFEIRAVRPVCGLAPSRSASSCAPWW